MYRGDFGNTLGPGKDPDGQMPGSVLLDFTTYIDKRRNTTTAFSTTREGHRIQVTFWFAESPRVSYFSVYCHGLEAADFPREPVIVATEDDLVLLRVVLGPRSFILDPKRYEYFIYQAGRVPSLHPIKHPGPSRCFADCQVGLLRCHPQHIDSKFHQFRRRSKHIDDPGHFYIIAALGYSCAMVPGQYDLYTFDSRTKVWDTKTALLRQEQESGEHSTHLASKVIVVGGEAGTMCWVDLSQGILFCDVLCREPVLRLRFGTLPPPLNPYSDLEDFPRTYRDIIIVNGGFKCVEFLPHIVPGSDIDADYVADGWTVATWTRKATTDPFEKEDNWQQDCMVHAQQVSVENNPLCLELLPKIVDDQGTPLPPLDRLHTANPTLSLHDDNVVYLMAKIHQQNTKAWVLAVDIRNRTLLGVADFVTRRTHGLSFAYMCSGIVKHLRIAPGCQRKDIFSSSNLKSPVHDEGYQGQDSFL